MALQKFLILSLIISISIKLSNESIFDSFAKQFVKTFTDAKKCDNGKWCQATPNANCKDPKINEVTCCFFCPIGTFKFSDTELVKYEELTLFIKSLLQLLQLQQQSKLRGKY